MAEHPEAVLGAEDCVKAAVDEFYTWLVGTYLPTRFPRIFKVLPAVGEKPSHLHNLATDDKISLQPADNPIESLRTLGGLVEDDFLFLLPSEDGDGYTMKGFVTCFPSGFDTRQKLNLKLRDIHKPVPNYKQKLEKSMDRFFQRLKTGIFVKRANVSHPACSSSWSWTNCYSGRLQPRTSCLQLVEIISTKGRVFRRWTSTLTW